MASLLSPSDRQRSVGEYDPTLSIQLPAFEGKKLSVRAQLYLHPSSSSRRVGIVGYLFFEGKEPLVLLPVEIEKLPKCGLNLEVGSQTTFPVATTNGKATQRLPKIYLDAPKTRKILISAKQSVVFPKESFSLYQLRLIVDTLNGSPAELSNPNYYRVKALPEKDLRQIALANSSLSQINRAINLSIKFHNRVMSGYDDLLRPILSAHNLINKCFEIYLQENLLASGLVIEKIEKNKTAAAQNVRAGDLLLRSEKPPLSGGRKAIGGRSRLRLTYNGANSSLTLKNEGQIGCFVIIESIDHQPNHY
ncbi:MAG TPA: hypothetical protein PKD37_04160 [Oligoflexia bacterium]|nr:hypothetical protein [Oligoflexia bacterium]HMP27161.1 hypothetical protein [Oligoflexia bacterium]